MDQVTTVRKHMKCEQWKSIITECRSSGMTVTAWCKANGICEQTYYRNLKKLRTEMLESFPVPVPEEKPVAFEYSDAIVHLFRKFRAPKSDISEQAFPLQSALFKRNIQVLKEEGKKPQTKSYMWVYRTANDGKAPVILYDYQPSRNGDHAADFLRDFSGYIHSDGYSGYNKLTYITRCGCWAHLRRKFMEAIPSKKGANAPLTSAEIGRDYCDRLFHIEKELKDLFPKERKLKRLELEKTVFDAFWCWAESLNTLKGSALGKAVTHTINQKPYMENYLLDGRCSLSNNVAENAIRSFTVGRKNRMT